MRDSAALAGVVHPVGVRSDCLGVFDVMPAWAVDASSEYVRRGDPIIDVLTRRLTEAPVLTEWCQLPEGESPRDYYRRGLDTVVERHVSMAASSGFPDQLASRPMDRDVYELWRRANVYAGYRYDAQASVAAEAGGVTADVTWTNRGVTSTHERWAIGYQLRDAAGRVVATAGSGLDLRDIEAGQDGATSVPTPATAVDSVRFAAPLEPGRYTVTVVVGWDEHKPGATTAVDVGAMNLAMTERVGSAYVIGSIVVR
jgi:hypothetical protein